MNRLDDYPTLLSLLFPSQQHLDQYLNIICYQAWTSGTVRVLPAVRNYNLHADREYDVLRGQMLGVWSSEALLTSSHT